MWFLYNFLFLPLYFSGILIASLFSQKAREWIKGRKDILHKMGMVSPRSSVVWFHCASLGEFEQGRPLIEQFKKEFPRQLILLTFFSPSGYKVRKDYKLADYVFYLPFDNPSKVKRFLDIWDPTMAIFVKYEFWFNYISQLKKRDIPIVMVSAIFRKDQHFFRSWGGWFRKQLKKISWFFVQDRNSLQLLEEAGIKNISVSGDTRFDRVAKIKDSPVEFPLVRDFAKGSKLLVAGSTWPADEDVLMPLINDPSLELKYIIAPHETDSRKIQNLKARINSGVVLFSEISAGNHSEAKVLIIDSVGILSQLYQYGNVAYIGGGFGKGIHNILEAAVFGLPVFFGPEYGKFAEARDLIRAGGAFSVENHSQLSERLLPLLNNVSLLNEASDICKRYITEKKGATEIIMKYMKEQSVWKNPAVPDYQKQY